MKTKGLRRSIMAMLVVFAMVFTYVPVFNTNIQTADAASVIKSNYKDESGYLFSLYDDGTAMASGYQGDTVPAELVIPSTCVQKGEGGNPDVEYKVMSVAISFFKLADGTNSTSQAKASIKSIVLPEGVTKFSGTTGYSELENVSLPESLTTIQGGTLGNCPKLKALHIPKNVETIGTDICTSAKDMKISIAEGNEHFKVIDGALYTADMTRLIFCEAKESIVVAETVTTIDYPVFSNRGGIKHVTLPSNMTVLGSQPFLNCADLETVVLPKAITAIPSNCFQNCAKLKSIEIPEGVTKIPGRAFSGCTSLEEVIIPSTCTDFTTNDQSHFWGCTSLKSLIIPDGTTYIPRRMIQNCTGLEFVVFPASITSAHDQAFQGISTDTIFIVESGSTVEGLLKAAGATEFLEFVDPGITNETLAKGTVGKEYSQKLEVEGFPVPELSVVAGDLPEGLTLNADGIISGTPEAAGEYKFTVKGYNGKTVTKEFTVVIEKAKEVKVKINDGGTEFSVNVDEKLALNPTVTNAEEGTYHIHWTKTDGKKYFKFVKNNGEELTDDTVSANSINVLGVQKTADGPDADPADIKVEVIEGKDHKNCTGTVLAEKDITLTVIETEAADPYAYGPQGKDLNKQSVLLVAPSDITQLYPAKDGDLPEMYVNEFGSKFDASKEITFTFKMGKGMGGNYNEAAFIENAVKKISVVTKDGTIAASYDAGTIMFKGMDNNVDRNLTIAIPADVLDADTEYVLIFDGSLKTIDGADELGVDVKFQFTTKKDNTKNPVEPEQPTQPEEPADDPTEDPVTGDEEPDVDTEEETDADENKDESAQTGDESSMASMFALMIAALLTAGAVIVRRKEN